MLECGKGRPFNSSEENCERLVAISMDKALNKVNYDDGQIYTERAKSVCFPIPLRVSVSTIMVQCEVQMFRDHDTI